MTDNTKNQEKFELLRKKAEKCLEKTQGFETRASFSKLMQELQVHQLELQLQNSELIETTKKLEESRDRFSFLYHHSPVGYATLDNSGIIREANNRLTEIIETPLNSIIFRPFSDLIHEEDKKIYFARFKAFIKKPENKALEIRLKKKSSFFHAKIEGRYIPVENKKQNTFDENILIIITDISQQKELEEKLRISKKMETASTMAGGFAHEFNNILSVIMGNAEMAIEVSRNPDQTINHLEEIIKASIKAKKLIENIMGISNFFFDNSSEIDIQSSIKNCVEKIRKKISGHIDIIINSKENIPSISADKNQIELAFFNIIDNAVSFMDKENGVVKIDISTQEIEENQQDISNETTKKKFIKIAISDSGIGIKPLELEKIFDPFYTTKPVGKGQGIGLSTANGIIRKSNGFIEVKSEENKGSVFSLYLPIH